MSGIDNRGPSSRLGNEVSFRDFCRMNYSIPCNESYYKLMRAAEHVNEPELFPLINGRRHVPKFESKKPDGAAWQPCVSNPRVAEIMVNSIQEYFRTHPDALTLNLAVNDGYGDCTCASCRAMDAAGADIATRSGLCDRYIKVDNRVAEAVAKEFPDKILAFIAYGSMSQPPTTVEPNPMLMPVLCAGNRANAFQMWDDSCKIGVKRMGICFYHDDCWFIMPKLDVHQSAKRLRYLVGSGLARSFCQEYNGIYPLNGMVGYVEQELIWDPRLDEDKLLDEYYAKFFGPAAGPMKTFYDLLEAAQAWWRAGRQAATRPALRALMGVAAFDASGQPLPRLVADPSYELRGEKAAESTRPDKDGHSTIKGVNVWCGPGSPMN